MSWLVAVLGLAFLVLIHEAGHFFAARSLGIARLCQFLLATPCGRVSAGCVRLPAPGAPCVGRWSLVEAFDRTAPFLALFYNRQVPA